MFPTIAGENLSDVTHKTLNHVHRRGNVFKILVTFIQVM